MIVRHRRAAGAASAASRATTASSSRDDRCARRRATRPPISMRALRPRRRRAARAPAPDAGPHRRRRLATQCASSHRDGARRDRSAIDLRASTLRYVPVGKSGDNVGITAFAVRRYRPTRPPTKCSSRCRASATQPSTVKLRAGARRRGRRVAALDARRRASACSGSIPTWPAPARASRRALQPTTHDALAARRRRLRAPAAAQEAEGAAGRPRGNLFLEGALLLDENLEVDKLAPAD